MSVVSLLRAKRNFLWKAALLFSWFPFLALSYYAQPFLDDYWNGAMGRDLGFVQASVFQFNNWSGRFFTNALLIALNPLSYGWLGGIKLVGVLSTLLKFGSLLWAARVLSARHLSRSAAAWLAAGILLFYYAALPDKYGSIYSFTYWGVYQAPCLLLLLVPLAVLKYHQLAGQPNRWLYLAAAAVGSICAAASNEMTLVLLGWVFLVGAGLSLYRRQWANASLWIGLGVLLGLSGIVSVVLAPGNHSRMQQEFVAQVSFAPGVLLPRIAKAFKYILTDASTLVIVVVPLLFYSLGQRLLAVRPAGLQLPFALGVVVVFAGLILGALPYNIVGYPALERPVNVLDWWLLLSWLVVCWASVPVAAAPARLPRAVVLLAALAVACVLAPSIGRAWLELLVDARPYQRQYTERYARLRQAAQQGQKEVVLDPIKHVTPRYILIRNEVGTENDYDVQRNAANMNNVRMAKWFGVDSIKLKAAQ